MRILGAFLAASAILVSSGFGAQIGRELRRQPAGKIPPTIKKELPKPTKPIKPISPEPSGILVEVGRHGLSMFSPLAPDHLGMGEKFLTRNAYPENYNASDPNRWEQGQREFGGLRLFGFDF
jgi:hypothetical protein